MRPVCTTTYYILLYPRTRPLTCANYRGTANTLNAKQHTVRRMIVDRLRYAIPVKLTWLQPGYEDMPVIIGTIGPGVDRNYAGWARVLFVVKQQQVHA
jgi:hypothetical protein